MWRGKEELDLSLLPINIYLLPLAGHSGETEGTGQTGRQLPFCTLPRMPIVLYMSSITKMMIFWPLWGGTQWALLGIAILLVLKAFALARSAWLSAGCIFSIVL